MAVDCSGGNHSVWQARGTLAPPKTFSTLARTTTAASNQMIMAVENTEGISYDILVFHTNAGGQNLWQPRHTSVATTWASGTYSTSTWHVVSAHSASTTSHAAYRDGANKGTSTANHGTSYSQNRLEIGKFNYSATNNGDPLSGQVAEVAVWSAALSDAEHAQLGKGFAPNLVRPNGLIHYMPLVRDWLDHVTGVALSTDGSPAVFAHPRVFMAD